MTNVFKGNSIKLKSLTNLHMLHINRNYVSMKEKNRGKDKAR